jgi:hypothetical protein
MPATKGAWRRVAGVSRVSKHPTTCCGTCLATYRESVALELEALRDLDAWVTESVPEDLVKGTVASLRANG